MLLTNLSEKQEFKPKYMIIAQPPDRPHFVTPSEASFYDSNPDMVAEVHYRPSADKDTQMSRYKAVELYDHQMLKHD